MKRLTTLLILVWLTISLSAQLPTINLGTPNAKNGDPNRTAFGKANSVIDWVNRYSTTTTLPPVVLIPQLPQDVTPDTILVIRNGRLMYATMGNINNTIYPVVPPAYTSGSYYVATNGSDSNPGTYEQPFLTWDHAFNQLSAGDTLYVRGGTYLAMKGSYGGNYYGVRVAARSGTVSDSIKVLAYPGETPILDCSALSAYAGPHYGLVLEYCDYWRIDGLTIKSVREYASSPTSYTGSGWELSDCNHIVMRTDIVTGCMNGFSLAGSVDNIYYLDCDSYLNYDLYQGGDLANGFNGNIDAGNHVFYVGCRAWNNCDDGYDNMAGGGYITYTNCWAWRNGYGTPTIGNGDGFKLGFTARGDEAGNQRLVYNCISANNLMMGYDESMDIATSQDMLLYNCISINNSNDAGFRFYQPLGTGVTTLRNNISYLSYSGRNYEGRARNSTSYNTWDTGTGVTVSAADFVSTDYTQLAGARQSNGSLPVITFLHIAPGSDLIDAGTDVGLPYNGAAPDLGPFESNY